MPSVVPVAPKTKKRFRDGCSTHWQLRPNPAEAALGVGKKTDCKRAPLLALKVAIENEIHRGTFVPDDKTTVAEWAARWLAAAPARGVRRRTMDHYTGHVRLYIVPTFGPRPMTSIRADEVRAWVADLRTRLQPSTIAKGIFAAMFNQWTADHRPLPRGNPVAGVVIRSEPKPHTDPLTVQQVKAWRDALPEDLRAVMDIEAYYGARMAEVLGLREEDLVWVGRDMSAPLADQLRRLAEYPLERYKSRNVLIRWQRQLGRREANGGASVGVPLKNKRAYRDSPLPQWLATTLAVHFAAHPPVDGWLFTNWRARSRGARAVHPRPWFDRSYLRWLTVAAEQAGIQLPPNQRSHALRHHCVSVLRDQGFSDQAIAAWIGDSAQTVQQVYGRPMPDSMNRMAETLDTAHASASGQRLHAVGE